MKLMLTRWRFQQTKHIHREETYARTSSNRWTMKSSLSQILHLTIHESIKYTPWLLQNNFIVFVTQVHKIHTMILWRKSCIVFVNLFLWTVWVTPYMCLFSTFPPSAHCRRCGRSFSPSPSSTATFSFWGLLLLFTFFLWLFKFDFLCAPTAPLSFWLCLFFIISFSLFTPSSSLFWFIHLHWFLFFLGTALSFSLAFTFWCFSGTTFLTWRTPSRCSLSLNAFKKYVFKFNLTTFETFP